MAPSSFREGHQSSGLLPCHVFAPDSAPQRRGASSRLALGTALEGGDARALQHSGSGAAAAGKLLGSAQDAHGDERENVPQNGGDGMLRMPKSGSLKTGDAGGNADVNGTLQLSLAHRPGGAEAPVGVESYSDME